MDVATFAPELSTQRFAAFILSCETFDLTFKVVHHFAVVFFVNFGRHARQDKT